MIQSNWQNKIYFTNKFKIKTTILILSLHRRSEEVVKNLNFNESILN